MGTDAYVMQARAIESSIIKLTGLPSKERKPIILKLVLLIGNFWVGHGTEMLPALAGHVSTVVTFIDQAF